MRNYIYSNISNFKKQVCYPCIPCSYPCIPCDPWPMYPMSGFDPCIPCPMYPMSGFDPCLPMSHVTHGPCIPCGTRVTHVCRGKKPADRKP